MGILSGVADMAVSGLWKAGAIAALAAGVGASATLGYQWHMAAHDRDKAAADLVTERSVSADLSSKLREQNRAVDALAEQKRLADARGAAAQKLAEANGRRFDAALDATKGARATTCDEAMPTVDRILEAIR